MLKYEATEKIREIRGNNQGLSKESVSRGQVFSEKILVKKKKMPKSK